MHVSHIIAVEADDYDEAIALTESFLEDDWDCGARFPWSDWNQLDKFDGGDSALCYADNRELFESLVKMMVGAREERLDEYLRIVKESGLDLDNLKEKGKENQWLNGIWALHKAMSIITQDSGSDAYFYDCVDYTEDPSYLQERIKSDPPHQWIVLVDFHF